MNSWRFCGSGVRQARFCLANPALTGFRALSRGGGGGIFCVGSLAPLECSLGRKWLPRCLALPRCAHSGMNCSLCGAAVTERLARSPPTKENRNQFPAGSPDFRKLVIGFSRGSPVRFLAESLVSQNLDVKSGTDPRGNPTSKVMGGGGAIRATLTRTPIASSLLRARLESADRPPTQEGKEGRTLAWVATRVSPFLILTTIPCVLPTFHHPLPCTTPVRFRFARTPPPPSLQTIHRARLTNGFWPSHLHHMSPHTRQDAASVTSGDKVEHRTCVKFPFSVVTDKDRGVGMQGRGKRNIPEITRRPAASSGMIPTCENTVATLSGIEPGSPCWEANRVDCRKYYNLVVGTKGNVQNVLHQQLRHPVALMNPWETPDCFATRHNMVEESAHIVHWGCTHKCLQMSPQIKV
ncbi:hypothetical protein PR048_023951 [Dryococelus australis]|uniref:Uncharacterized protein n=1 Tax=Dryococelus australis TaxID=614101 RepID=A0ABQ9GVH0_9NEOP|nr:hypothetical protein PR048_023951 [Dryococelus australis]